MFDSSGAAVLVAFARSTSRDTNFSNRCSPQQHYYPVGSELSPSGARFCSLLPNLARSSNVLLNLAHDGKQTHPIVGGRTGGCALGGQPKWRPKYFSMGKLVGVFHPPDAPRVPQPGQADAPPPSPAPTAAAMAFKGHPGSF